MLAVRVMHMGRLFMNATMAATPVIFVPFHSSTELSRNTSSSRSRFVCTLVWYSLRNLDPASTAADAASSTFSLMFIPSFLPSFSFSFLFPPSLLIDGLFFSLLAFSFLNDTPQIREQ